MLKNEKDNRPIRFGCPCRYGRHLCCCFTIAGRLQLCLPGFRVRRALSLSYLNVLPRLETVVQVPIMEGVPHLIENDSRIACHGVDVGIRISIDPNIYPALSKVTEIPTKPYSYPFPFLPKQARFTTNSAVPESTPCSGP